MKQIVFALRIPLFVGPLATLLLSLAGTREGWTDDLDRSPIDLALGPAEAWLATANQTSDSVSLIELPSGKLLDEITVGARPAAIVTDPVEPRIFVTTAHDGHLRLLRVEQQKLVIEASIDLGGEPHGIALSRDRASVYVALTATSQVAVVDLADRRLRTRIDVGRWPRYLTVSNDGKRLAVGTSGDLGVCLVDLESNQLLFQERYYALNIGHLISSPDGQHIVHPWTLYGNNAITPPLIRQGWVIASRLGRLRWDGPSHREAIALDSPGVAVSDVFGIGYTAGQRQLVVSAGGTHELLVYAQDALPWREYGIGDHLDRDLQRDTQLFWRIPVGGRPMGLRPSSRDAVVFVANYLENSVQEVDVVERRIVRAIGLGGPATPSLVRRGESIFLDGQRSLDQWYSCHSCHYEGGSNAVRMDTMNDGTPNTFKTVLPLYHLKETGPWTWHGWQKDLDAALRHSLTTTMLGKQPTDDDTAALHAYLEQLQAPPNPLQPASAESRAAVERGQRLFHSEKAGCAQCHPGPRYTDNDLHDVGLGSSKDKYPVFNTPSLNGVFRKVRLLHDGRAKSLEQVLTEFHNPAKVTGKGDLSADELRDLIEFLKTL
jgi:DNA-binding beta-propeller fold protein YncE